MTNDTDEVDDGRGGLRAHLPRVAVPPELDRRVRETLESRGLIRQGGAWVGSRQPTALGRHGSWALLAGLLVAGFLLGLFARDTLGSSGGPSGDGAAGQYVLLLYGAAGDTGAVHVAREREYGRWASGLAGARWVGGHELHEVVESLGPSSSASASSEARLAGYFVIEAPSRERAAEVARTCPHLKYGGRVVVMTIAG